MKIWYLQHFIDSVRKIRNPFSCCEFIATIVLQCTHSQISKAKANENVIILFEIGVRMKRYV